ncbi:MAG: alpha/beta hydrolase-fold protein [Pirellulales bacterium]
MRTSLIAIALIALLSSITFAQPPGLKGPRRPGGLAKGGTTELKVNQTDPPARFDVAQASIERGKVTPFEYESKAGSGNFKATIYTPPGYSSTKKYPVLYLLHGASGDENNWVQPIHADAILDNLYAEKKLAPMLVVMPSALSVSAREKAGNDRDAKSRAGMAFGDVLLKDLIPHVESKYPVAAGREQRALAGLSMGAGIALNTGLSNSDQFAWVGAFSGGGSRIQDMRFDITSKDRQLRLLWLSVGDRDNLTGSGMASADAYLTEKKVPHVFRVNAGGHEPKVWMNDLYYFAPLLFKDSK